MPRIHVLFVLILFSCLCAAPAWAGGVEMPEKLKSEFTQYPDSEVIQVMTMGEGQVVFIDCGDVPVDTVFEYYKEKAQDSGWSVGMENKTSDQMMLMLEKGENKGVISVARDSDKTVVSMTISKN